MPYLQSFCFFITILLKEAELMPLDGFSNSGSMNLYIQSIMTISFLCAMWGLFLIMDLSDKFKLIKGHRFKLKAALLKIMVVFVNLQGLIINILVSFDVITCYGIGCLKFWKNWAGKERHFMNKPFGIRKCPEKEFLKNVEKWALTKQKKFWLCAT